MKIGIFGDSFAHVPNNKDPKNLTLSWPEYIAQKYETEFHAHPGTSLYYSVKKIKQYHEKYDKIILVVTNPGRFSFNEIMEKECEKTGYDWALRVQGLASVEHILPKIEDENSITKKAWLAAQEYFMYIYDHDFDNYLHSLMLEDMKKLRQDIILIPAFNISLPYILPRPTSMFCIQYFVENQHWGLNDLGYNPTNDIRLCHLTPQNNEIFANNVFKWIDGAPVEINLDDYKAPTQPYSAYLS